MLKVDFRDGRPLMTNPFHQHGSGSVWRGHCSLALTQSAGKVHKSARTFVKLTLTDVKRGAKYPYVMKKLSLILPLLFTIAAARADVLIVQKMESSMLNGDITTKIKGDKGRVDMPAGPIGQMSIIIDGASGEVNTLMHGQKMAMKMSGAQLKAAVEQSKAAAGATGETEKPKATGKTEKVGEWDTEIYKVKMDGVPAKVWVAKGFPNAEKLKAEMSKMSKSMGQGSGDVYGLDLPGMPVKSEIESPAGKMTVTITKAVEQAVDAKEFEIPADYQKMDMPAQPK